MTGSSSPPEFDCAQVYVLLYEYLDAALPPDRRAAVAAHLAACSHCGELARLQGSVRDLAAVAGNTPAPSGMEDRMRRFISSDHATPDGGFPDGDAPVGAGTPVARPNATISEEDAALARSQMAE